MSVGPVGGDGTPEGGRDRADTGGCPSLLKFEAAALHWSCYTTGDETEVQASQEEPP